MEQKKRICVKASLVGSRMDGAYEHYVFINSHTNEYIMCTRMPNWQVDKVDIGEEGFLEYQDVIGGQDRYYDSVKDGYRLYQIDATYFLNFVPITKVLKDGYVVDKTQLVVK